MPKQLQRYNANLDNCRARLCLSVKRMAHTDRPSFGVWWQNQRALLLEALSELDAFRAGRLQKCQHCSDGSYDETPGP